MSWSALHPMRTDQFRLWVQYSHAVVIELPEMAAFEKVGLAVDVLKGSVNI